MPEATSGGVRIHFEAEGSGPPLLLHHGLSDSMEGWREYGHAARLRESYRLILIDARGHGRSDKPRGPENYSLEQRVADVVAVMDELDLGSAHFWGYSLGAWTGLGLAWSKPGRVRSLIAGGAHPYRQNMSLFRQILAMGIEAWGAALKTFVPDASPETVARILTNDVDALRDANATDRPAIAETMSGLQVPALFYAGAGDPGHRLVERCAGEVPGATFVSLPDLNHFAAAVRSDLILPRALRFLAEVEARLHS